MSHAGEKYPTFGKIIRHAPAIDKLIPEDATIEIIVKDLKWCEGPVWFPATDKIGGGYLLFSDIPRNSVFKWEEGKEAELYLKPSGFTGPINAAYGKESGSNGLLRDPKGRLVSCEHGDRRISVLTKKGGKRTLVDNYQGKRLNSPNDACYHSNGDLYFTDPPYGLPKNMDDPRKELDFQGLFRLSKDGKVTLLNKNMTRPNGIAFSPDEKTLYVAQSDPKAAHWMSYPVKEDGTLGDGKIFYDVTKLVGLKPGLPDGLKVDSAGNIWASGPGGVYVFSPDAKLLGLIETNDKTSNCAWGGNGSVLYITVNHRVCRIQTTTKGNGW